MVGEILRRRIETRRHQIPRKKGQKCIKGPFLPVFSPNSKQPTATQSSLLYYSTNRFNFEVLPELPISNRNEDLYDHNGTYAGHLRPRCSSNNRKACSSFHHSLHRKELSRPKLQYR